MELIVNAFVIGLVIFVSVTNAIIIAIKKLKQDGVI